MKIKQIFTLLLTVIVLGVSACKTSPKDALARKWKATDAAGPMISPDFKKMLVGEQNTIEFMKDGSYSAWSKGKEDDKGTYTLSDDGKTLTTKSANTKREESIAVKELTSNKMVGEMQGITITFEPSK